MDKICYVVCKYEPSDDKSNKVIQVNLKKEDAKKAVSNLMETARITSWEKSFVYFYYEEVCLK